MADKCAYSILNELLEEIENFGIDVVIIGSAQNLLENENSLLGGSKMSV